MSRSGGPSQEAGKGAAPKPGRGIRAVPGSIWRRLAAMVYDGLLTVGIIMIAVLILVALNGGEAVVPRGPWVIAYQLYLLCVGFLYYGASWTKSGQTLGMKIWRIRVQSLTGERLGWAHAFLRYVLSVPSVVLLPLTYVVWSLFDPDGQAAHDRLSRSQVVRVLS